MPTTTKTTAESSPLSVLSGIGAGAAGLFSGSGTTGAGPSIFDNIMRNFSGIPSNADAVTNPYFTPMTGVVSNPSNSTPVYTGDPEYTPE